MKQIAKKTIILYVLKILYRGSSYNKPINQKQICNVLNSLGVPCDRRTISRNIKYLIDFGLPIFRTKGLNGGYYYARSLDTFFSEPQNFQPNN